jgi:hypothetical protein
MLGSLISDVALKSVSELSSALLQVLTFLFFKFSMQQKWSILTYGTFFKSDFVEKFYSTFEVLPALVVEFFFFKCNHR